MEALQELTTTGDIIDTLGGEDAVGLMVGAKYKTVNNWRNFNSFPATTHGRLNLELCQKGYTASPKLWKQVGFDRRNLLRITRIK